MVPQLKGPEHQRPKFLGPQHTPTRYDIEQPNFKGDKTMWRVIFKDPSCSTLDSRGGLLWANFFDPLHMLKPFWRTRMLTRDLFAVANLLTSCRYTYTTAAIALQSTRPNKKINSLQWTVCAGAQDADQSGVAFSPDCADCRRRAQHSTAAAVFCANCLRAAT